MNGLDYAHISYIYIISWPKRELSFVEINVIYGTMIPGIHFISEQDGTEFQPEIIPFKN